MPDTPQTFGHWKLVSETALFVVVQCECGRQRTIRKSTWRAAKHISQKCKACLVRESEIVHAWIYNKKPLKARVTHG